MKRTKNIIDTISLLMMSKTDNAFDHSDDELIKVIDSVPDINFQGRDDRTLLIHASLYNRYEIAKYLLKKGADVTLSDDMGISALHGAVISGDLNIVELLVKNNAPVNQKDRFGNIPLFKAKINDISIIKFLIKSGSDYNSKNNSGISVVDTFAAYPEILKLMK